MVVFYRIDSEQIKIKHLEINQLLFVIIVVVVVTVTITEVEIKTAITSVSHAFLSNWDYEIKQATKSFKKKKILIYVFRFSLYDTSNILKVALILLDS